MEPITDAYDAIYTLMIQGKQSQPRNILCNQKEAIFRHPPLQLRQDRGVLGLKGQTGTVVWDSSVRMSLFLQQHVDYVKGKRVLELGAGCGLAGMVAYDVGALEVMLTDQLPVLPLLHKNVELNMEAWQEKNKKQAWKGGKRGPHGGKGVTEAVVRKMDVGQLDWGEDGLPDYIEAPYDVVLCCDCIYNDAVNPLLVQTLVQVCNASTTIFIAQELRTEDVLQDMLERLLETFDVWRIEDDGKHCIVIFLVKMKSTES